MISSLTIRHFKAIESLTVPLGPITVLIGPNDSGKSTILQALMALSRAISNSQLGADQVLDCPLSVAGTNQDSSKPIELAIKGGAGPKPAQHRYDYAVSMFANTQRVERRFEEPESREDLYATLLRLDARAIARPSPLDAPLLADGSGLVGIVDELLTSGTGDAQIAEINESLQRLTPHVKSVAAKKHPGGGKELHFALRSGAVIPASQMSDGVVLAAALVIIALVTNRRLLLIEEPENGLHPRQLKIVSDTIRALVAKGAQVVMTTHSPLLLNHFGADETLLVTRSNTGVSVQSMSAVKNFDELASDMSLGELWYNVGDSNLARPA